MSTHVYSAIPISENVYWVGAIDWGLRDFHGYLTSRGTTYNAYLVIDEKITLIDTVKKPFYDQLISRISSVIKPNAIDYIISNHAEMDHSGCLPEALHVIKPEKLYTSKAGIKALTQHFSLPNELLTPVSNGDEIQLGNYSLQFFETKMLHWPESMVTYLPQHELLFSQDAFGMHLATSKLFDDENEQAILTEEAAKYYANILTPFSKLVARTLNQFNQQKLKVSMIAPDHGPIWRSKPNYIMDLYTQWSHPQLTDKLVIVFDTMWNSTEKMAHAIGSAAQEQGIETHIMPLRSSHRSDVATQILDAAAIAVGTPTINNQLYPTVADCLSYIRGLKPPTSIAVAFGSYGWSGEGVKQADDYLKSMNIDTLPAVNAQYIPNKEVLAQCHETGLALCSKIKEITQTK